MADPPRSPFGLPRRDEGNGHAGGDAEPAAGPSQALEDLTLSIKGVRATEGDEPGEMRVELNTTRGVITAHLAPCEGRGGVAVFLGGAAGGVRGPADSVYVRLAPDLVAQGVTALRVEYRDPGEFDECVLDTLAACSFLKGIGAQRAVLVGHSFGGAVAVKAGELAPLVAAVCGLSSQRFGTFEVDVLAKPLLLVHGSRDEVLDQQASRDIYERAKEPRRLVILDGSGHGLLEHRDEVYGLLRDFILEHVGETADAG